MRAYREVGEPSRALATYRSLAAALRDELGVEPAPQTRRVHLAILREEREGTTAPVSARTGAPGPCASCWATTRSSSCTDPVALA